MALRDPDVAGPSPWIPSLRPQLEARLPGAGPLVVVLVFARSDPALVEPALLLLLPLVPFASSIPVPGFSRSDARIASEATSGPPRFLEPFPKPALEALV
jgi:hypothetical protein